MRSSKIFISAICVFLIFVTLNVKKANSKDLVFELSYTFSKLLNIDIVENIIKNDLKDIALRHFEVEFEKYLKKNKLAYNNSSKIIILEALSDCSFFDKTVEASLDKVKISIKLRFKLDYRNIDVVCKNVSIFDYLATDYSESYKDKLEILKKINYLIEGCCFYKNDSHLTEILNHFENLDQELRKIELYQAALVAFVMNNKLDALNYLTRLIEKYPKFCNAYKYRGMIYANKSKFEEAIADYEIAFKLKPNDFRINANMAAVYGEIKNYDKAIKYITNAININPNHELSYTYRGYLYKEKKMYVSAIKEYTKAIGIDPLAFGTYYDRGYVYYLKDNFEKAIDDFSMAINLNKDDHRFFLARGVALYKQNKIQDGLKDLSRACDMGNEEACSLIQSDSQKELEYVKKAWAYYEDNKIEESKKILDRLVSPNSELLVEIKILYGLIYVYKGEYEKALGSVEKIKNNLKSILNESIESKTRLMSKDEEEYIKLLYKQALYVSGMSNYFKERYGRAAVDLETYVEGVDDGQLFALLGRSLFKIKKFNKSAFYYQKAYHLINDDNLKEDISYNLACVYSQLEDVENAVKWLRVPLSGPRKDSWFSKISMDDDFNTIRESDYFINSINDYLAK